MPGLLLFQLTAFILFVKGAFLILALLVSQGWIIGLTIVGVEIWLLVMGVRHMRFALRTRPADVWIDDDGLRVDGGRPIAAACVRRPTARRSASSALARELQSQTARELHEARRARAEAVRERLETPEALNAADYKTAHPLFAKACELGDLNACNWLAFETDKGQGVTADAAAARTIYERTCAARPETSETQFACGKLK